jgi:hypothetical protein
MGTICQVLAPSLTKTKIWELRVLVGLSQARRFHGDSASAGQRQSFVQDGWIMSQYSLNSVHGGSRDVKESQLALVRETILSSHSNTMPYWLDIPSNTRHLSKEIFPFGQLLTCHMHLAVVTNLDIGSSRPDRILDNTRPADCIGIVLCIDALHQAGVDSYGSNQSGILPTKRIELGRRNQATSIFF